MDAHSWDRCLSMIGYGSDRLKRGDFDNARKALAAVLVESRVFPAGDARDLQSLALYNLSLMLSKQGHAGESAQVRERASAALPAVESRERPAAYLAMLGDVLSELGAHRKAIPYYEECVKLLLDAQDPVAVADMLWRAGKAYSQCGLSDHAAIPLRAAARVFRTRPEDPRFPVVLISLGNALRRSAPVEAESCYREAALVWTGRGHLESATAAWVNLGVLCSEQDRLDEALAFYEQALHIRQAAAGTPKDRLGTLHNNIANCYRRRSNFIKARHSVELALKFLEPGGGPVLGSAYGTRALISRDQGNDADAVAWFRKATAHFKQQASPNIETMLEELENEAAALRRLGRVLEAVAAEQHAVCLKASIQAVPASTQDLSDLGVASPGAVFVELEYGLRPRNGTGKLEVGGLADRLWTLTRSLNVGRYGGTVATPESSTVMFYADNAEILYSAIYPTLASEPLCRGARITIRQGSAQRELLLPGTVM